MTDLSPTWSAWQLEHSGQPVRGPDTSHTLFVSCLLYTSMLCYTYHRYRYGQGLIFLVLVYSIIPTKRSRARRYHPISNIRDHPILTHHTSILAPFPHLIHPPTAKQYSIIQVIRQRDRAPAASPLRKLLFTLIRLHTAHQRQAHILHLVSPPPGARASACPET